MKTNPTRPTAIDHVAAAPGTRIVILDTDFMADAAAKHCLVETREFPVICWEIRKTSYGHTWAHPVTTEILDEYDTYAVILPDGQVDLTTPIAHEEEFEGKTLAEAIAWLDKQTRDEIRNARCLDCGKDLRQTDIWGLESDSPILQDALWNSIVRGRGMLCKAHMEQRLGRPLTAADVKKRPSRP